MKITVGFYEETGNPEILFDEFPVTVNPCHLPRGGTALNTRDFPEALECLETLELCGPVVAQGKIDLVRNWVNSNKLEPCV